MLCLPRCVFFLLFESDVLLTGYDDDSNALRFPACPVCWYKVEMRGQQPDRKARENGSKNRFLSRVRSAAMRECEP